MGARDGSLSPRALYALVGLLTWPGLGVVPSPAAAQTVRGTVVHDSTGAPIEAVEVSLLDRGRRVRTIRTNDSGQFRLALPSPGEYALRAARLGFMPAQTHIEVTARNELTLALRLTRAPHVLPTETISENWTERNPWFEGFHYRRRNGLGTYFTREDLEKRGNPRLTDLLRGIVGVDVVSSSRRVSPTMARSSIVSRCHPVLYMDGFRMHRFDERPEVIRAIYEGIPPTTIEAIEVYKGRSQLPAEFGGPESRCGAIVIWTRRGNNPKHARTP